MVESHSPRQAVLVVDDDEELALTISEVLRTEGFEVSTTGTGEGALEHCRSHEPAVILLDFELPDMSGQNVCRQLRTFSDAYVLMLTGRTSESDKIVSLSVGVDDYVTKPFSYGELVARLHALLRRPRSDAATPITSRSLGRLRIDLMTREVIVDDNHVELTRTEFDLLEVLSANAGTVVKRRELLEQVWSTTWSEEDHIIDVHW